MRLLGSFAFRFALIQVGLFTILLSALLGLIYWVSIDGPTNEIKAGITNEAAGLTNLYRDHGIVALGQALERRATARVRRQGYHILLAGDGHVVTNNLPSWPPPTKERWLRLNADIFRDGIADDHEALSLDVPLPGGARLLIGRDVEDLDRITEEIRSTIFYFVPGMLLMVIAAAAVTSRAIGKRIDVMSGTARRVMEGNLSERVPVRGNRDDFGRLGGTLNAMLDRIEASLESVRRVSDSVAHELRTPLARLQAELAELRNAPPERIPELAERAQGESERLGRMADAVLRISRIEAKRHHSEMRPVDFGALIADAVEYHAPLAEARGQRLAAEIAPDLTIFGDPDLLFQAVSNLVDNAIKFTPENGWIAISARGESNRIALTIADNGRGVDAALIGKIGERFYRAPTANDVPGFGLGLALVSAVAALHESVLIFTNTEPGLRVLWRLPRRHEAYQS